MAKLEGAVLLFIQLLFTTSSAKIGYFWHITDIHYDMNYTMEGDSRRMCWRQDQGPGGGGGSGGGSSGGGGGGTSAGGGGSGRRPSGRLGDHSCDSPWGLVESAARAMKSKQGDNIEFVLWTGDDIAHANDDHLSTDKVLMVMQNLTDLLRHTFSSQFVFPVLGNHDFYPKNQISQSMYPVYKKVADMWRHWLPTEAIDSFEKGGYYTIEQKGRRFRLVALNTNLYYQGTQQGTKGRRGGGMAVRRRGEIRGAGNWGVAGVEEDGEEEVGEEDDPAGQWRWLEGVLEKSQRNKETVYLVGHVPPGVDERRPIAAAFGTFKERFNRRYLDLVRKYSQVIVGQFFGHHHSDSFRVIYDDRGQPISWIFLAPSVTPWRTPSGANNPGIRLYKFDTDTGQILDFMQYYLDLSTATHLDSAEWRLEYNFTSFYGLPNISAASLHELAQTFEEKPATEIPPTTSDKVPTNNVDNGGGNNGGVGGGVNGGGGSGGGVGGSVVNAAASSSSSAVSLPVVSHMLGADLFERYYRANSVSYHYGSGLGTCNAVCRRGHYCSITRVDFADFRECIDVKYEEVKPIIPTLASSRCDRLYLSVGVLLFSVLFSTF